MDFDFGYSFGLPSVLSPFARLIPTLAGSQYGTIDTAVTFTGDFEVTSNVATTYNTTSIKAVFGGVATGAWVGSAAAIGNVGFVLDTLSKNNIVPVTVNPYDGKIHEWKIIRVGTTISLYIDDILQDSGTGAGGSVTFNEIGSTQTNSLYFWIGQILSVKFNNITTGAIRNFVFDSGSDTAQYARGSTTDKVTLINFSVSDWTRYAQQRNYVYLAVTYPLAWVDIADPSNFLEVA